MLLQLIIIIIIVIVINFWGVFYISHVQSIHWYSWEIWISRAMKWLRSSVSMTYNVVHTGLLLATCKQLSLYHNVQTIKSIQTGYNEKFVRPLLHIGGFRRRSVAAPKPRMNVTGWHITKSSPSETTCYGFQALWLYEALTPGEITSEQCVVFWV